MTNNDLMVFITGWFRYYVILPKAVPFIWGLILVHSWVEYALVALLITHLADVLKHLLKATAVVNILDGTTAVLTLVMAYLSETYLGPFLTIVCITTADFFGLLLFYLGSVKTIWLLYVTVILVGLGRAGRDIQLKEFLSDQCRTTEEAAVEDEERVESRRKIWWRSAYMLGIVASVFLFIETEWKELCKILIIAMAVAFVVFLLGFSFYERKKPAKSTLYNIMRVLYTAITNRRRRHPLEYQRVNIQTLSVFNRWLDRAAVEESSSGGGRVSLEQVEEVKSLLNMLPFWSMSLIYGLMLATGNTFFYLQTEYTANYLGPISPLSPEQSDYHCNHPELDISHEVPAIIFVIIRYSVFFVVSRLCDFLLRLRWGNDIPGRVMLVRSGVGLAVSPLCCLVAWKVEERRRHQRREYGVCIRFSWLIPQFVLLGVMEGLVQEAMEEFYVCVVPQRLGRYARVFTMFAQNIGHFGSLLFIFIFRDLFDEDDLDLDYNKLGDYYRNLSYVCCVNLVIYCCVAAYYAKQELSGGGGGGGGGEVMEQSLEQMHQQAGHESVGVVGDEQVF